MTLNERNAKIEANNQGMLDRIVSTERTKSLNSEDLTGKVYHNLSVLSYAGKDKKSYKIYWVSCSCGSIPKLIYGSSLNQGTKSCGCHRDKYVAEDLITHGLTKDPWYQIANHQQQRMTNPKNPEYHNYGGRGLTFGEGMETIEDRILFYREKFGSKLPEGLEVDRIDNDLGYAKDNVRLVSKSKNNLNRRDSHGFSGGIFDKRTRVYETWIRNKKRENLCDEWAADFKVFLADIGGRDLPKDRYLARYDVQKSFGPDNYYFSDTIQRRPSYLMPK